MKLTKEIVPEIVVTSIGLLVLGICFGYLIKCDKEFLELTGIVRVIVALASAAVSIALPGFINLETVRKNNDKDTLWPKIKAGGALAVFVLVYLFNPIK